MPENTRTTGISSTQLDYDTSKVETKDIAYSIESFRLVAYNHRRIHERRWYDNNFFDDGFHFRYLSRSTNRIVDLSERATIYTPQRAIPKASRQIRGIANLLLSSDPTPTVYPQDTPITQFRDNQQAYQDAKTKAKDIALKQGYWLLDQWNTPDASGETLLEKLALMPILTAKHSVSYMQIWADPVYEKIRTQVFDAFDLYVIGNYTSLQDCPFIIKATPMLVSQVLANPYFDEDQKLKVTPDNKPAGSEIKQAYMRARFGRDSSADQAGTVILIEAFLKEYLNKDNMARIRKQENGETILKDREEGDCIIRQVFASNGGAVWLRDQYLDMDDYPFVDFRMEPGPLYQVPLIERFMNANKSLDSAVSRMERYFHTMVTGMWLKHRGEQFKLNNIAGGQVIEYDQHPPEQAALQTPGEWTFAFMNLLTNFIEEQGVSTTTLGKLPAGVKANAAIESLKESEYANLIIATRRLRETVRRVAHKMFEVADKHFITPQDSSYTKRGDTTYFKVIGATALKGRKKLKVETDEDVVPLSKDVKISIEIEQGMAYTKEGQKDTVQALINTMLEWAKLGVLPTQAVQVVIEKYLETYQFGSTAEFMEAFESGMANQNLSEQQMLQMKTALLQALQEAGEIGPEGDQSKIMTTKIGVLEALKESGLHKGLQEPPKPPAESISYKDAPEDIKRQMEAQAGLQPSRGISPSGTDQIIKHINVNKPQPNGVVKGGSNGQPR